MAERRKEDIGKMESLEKAPMSRNVSPMPMMQEYKVLSCETAQELSQAVTEHLQNVWYVMGGVTCSVDRAGMYITYTYAQALMREVPVPSPEEVEKGEPV